MIKIENVVTPSVEQWKAVIRGMRNPLNSWDNSDSYSTHIEDVDTIQTADFEFFIGENDLSLMKKLRNAGKDHRKFMRMITVYVDVTAPLYWWKEADTYKVGTVANSCSTMHKIHAKEFTLDDFSCEHLFNEDSGNCFEWYHTVLKSVIHTLNTARCQYLETKDKKYWWQMIQLLPSSYNQRRTVQMNYEVLANMYHSRKAHKLDEWVEFCKWIETLPYSELITGGV